MPTDAASIIVDLIERNHAALLTEWISSQRMSLKGSQLDSATVENQSKRFIEALRTGTKQKRLADISGAEWAAAREILEDVSRTHATMGSSPAETATFVFSLKGPLFNSLRKDLGGNAETLADAVWDATLLIDKLGLYTIEAFQRGREQVISRQQEELLELSTPVVQLWEGILALPLIGTLDSARTQVVMESLLQEIVRLGAEIAIIDITGVPTVDTLVAQHLLKTISAARLMGADCIISGIRPQIAQTIVHLGVQLDVISKATMADAFAVALRRTGKTVVNQRKPNASSEATETQGAAE